MINGMTVEEYNAHEERLRAFHSRQVCSATRRWPTPTQWNP